MGRRVLVLGVPLSRGKLCWWLNHLSCRLSPGGQEFTPLENTMESLLLKEDIANAPFLYDLPCVGEKVSLHKSSDAGHIKLIHRKLINWK